MDFLLDDPEIEKKFKSIVRAIPLLQNGVTVKLMEDHGVHYEKNWGASLTSLKDFASTLEPCHLLALKLWNKKWRETMILATMLEEPNLVSEEQLDFWIKTSEQTEIVEQCVFNFVTKTPFAFSKALEWLLGKKNNVKIAGLLSMGRLAMTDKSAIDEMFEPFFEPLALLAKDESLFMAFYRSFCQLARRSRNIYNQCLSFLAQLKDVESDAAKRLANELLEELSGEFYSDDEVFFIH